MPIAISSLVPNVIDLLGLEVEDLANVLLVHLNSYKEGESTTMQRGQINRQALFANLERSEYPGYHDKNKVNRALMEAWTWLEREVFLIQDPFLPAAWFFISRRGQRLKSGVEFETYRKASLLPKGQLHPLIASTVYPVFLRGDYDIAVFQAFREIEVAVRQAGQFPPDLVGDKLMRTAFAVAKNNLPAGPLTDTQLPVAEQEAMAHLFAGAFGLYRNSTAHRYVPTKPEEAAEVIMFASQLLRIVDRLRPQA